MDASNHEVEYYRSGDGKAPYRDRFERIADEKIKLKLDARVARMRGGNFGDSKPIGDGASENRIDFGPGYRIYYGVDGKKVILLGLGDKSTQDEDIKRAKACWRDYKSRKNPESKTASKKKAKP